MVGYEGILKSYDTGSIDETVPSDNPWMAGSGVRRITTTFPEFSNIFRH